MIALAACAQTATTTQRDATGPRPPALPTHGTGDDTLSAYDTCARGDRMRAAGRAVTVDLRDGAPHVMPEDFARDACRFLSRHQRTPAGR